MTLLAALTGTAHRAVSVLETTHQTSVLTPGQKLSAIVDAQKGVNRIPGRNWLAYKAAWVEQAKKDGGFNPRWVEVPFGQVGFGDYSRFPKPTAGISTTVRELRRAADQEGVEVEVFAWCSKNDPVWGIRAKADGTEILCGGWALDARCVHLLCPNGTPAEMTLL